MAFGGLKKIIRKNKKGLKKVAGFALSAVAPVIASKLATTAAGMITKAAGSGARRKVKAEKSQKINAALAAQIDRPQLAMTASRETAAARNMPGGSSTGAKRVKSGATHGPGGATVNAMSKAASSHKGEPLGIASAVGSFLKKERAAKKSSDKVRAAAAKKQASADKKAAAAAVKKQKAAEKKAASAEKKAKRSALQEIGASALGVKLGSSKTSKAAAGKLARSVAGRTKTALKRAVKGSLKGSQVVPIAGATAGILYAGGKALDANAAAQVRKAEKKLKRRLTDAEVKTLTTPRNTFSGK